MLGRLFARRRWIIWLVALPLLVGGGWGVVVVLNAQAERATRTADRDKLAADLDASDPGWRAADLCTARNAALPPPELNAAELAHRAFAKLTPEYLQWESRPQGLLPPLSHLPTPDQSAEMRLKLGGVKAGVDAARAIRIVPSGGFPLTYLEPAVIDTPIQRTEDLRVIATLLMVDADVRAYDGDADGALDSALAILAVARGIGDEPTPFSQFQRAAVAAVAVSSVERTLALCDTSSDAKLAEVESALRTEAEAPRMRYALRGERAILYRQLENLHAGPVVTKRKFSAPAVDELSVAQTRVLDVYTQLLAAAELPHGPTRDAAIFEIRRQLVITREKPAARFVYDFFPRIEKTADADSRTTAWLRAGAAAVACERQRLKTGELPETLADPPTDPFTGRPLLLAVFGDGIAVYSAGVDHTDHGGVHLDATLSEWADVGVKLFEPKHRRRPSSVKE